MQSTVEIKIPSNPKYLKILRCSVEHLCMLCGFQDSTGDAINLAVNEAATNIIKHAYQNNKTKPILVKLQILEDRFEIVLRDYGQKAEVERIKSRQLEDVKPGGLGVHIIKSTMDVVNYDNSLQIGNRLTLAKYLPGK